MIILDTNVLSELMRPKPSPRVSAWIGQQAATEIFTTAMTEAEIFYGIELLVKNKRREQLLAAADALFTEDLAGRVLAFDSVAARVFSHIAAHRRGLGRPISHADAQIAAVTQVQGARLATRNTADFADCGSISSILGVPPELGLSSHLDHAASPLYHVCLPIMGRLRPLSVKSQPTPNSGMAFASQERQTLRVLSSVVGKGGNLAQAEQALIGRNECQTEHLCCSR